MAKTFRIDFQDGHSESYATARDTALAFVEADDKRVETLTLELSKMRKNNAIKFGPHWIVRVS